MRPELRLQAGNLPPLGAYDADIIILALNRLEETRAAIASALAQRGGVFHVSVLDQGSSPEMRHALAAEFGRLHHFALYHAEANGGVARGRNLLARLGHGQVLVGLDNDARFPNGHAVIGALRLFQRQPDLGAIGFAILAADGQGPDLTSWGYSPALLPRFKDRFETACFVGAGHAIRRAAWNAVGGYDENFFFAWEEYDFCLAAISRGWRILYDGSLAVIHTPAAEARCDWHSGRMLHFVRNRLIIDRKWGTSWLGLAPRICAYGMVAARHNCFPAAWQGVRQGLHAHIASPRRMSSAMRAYLRQHEVRHRAPLLKRLFTRLSDYGLRLP